MATFTKIADFVEGAMEGLFNLASDNIALALSNTAPGSETSNPTATGNGVLANVTQISYTNYTDDLTVDRRLEGVTSNESGGTYTFDANDVTITASGGAIADFRYFYVFDDTQTVPADPLIGVWDHGSTVSLASGNSATISWNASGLFTVA